MICMIGQVMVFAVVVLRTSALFAVPEFPPGFPRTHVLSATEKRKLIQQLLAAQPQKLTHSRAGYDASCPLLYEALRSGKGVEFIPPKFRTEEPEDPRFEKYNKCAEFDWKVETQRQFSNMRLLGERHFELYELPSPDTASPIRELLYAEVNFDDLGRGLLGSYFQIDLAECASNAGVGVDQRADYANLPSNYPRSVHGVVAHDGRYIVIDLVDLRVATRTQPEDPPLYGTEAWELTLTEGFRQICTWRVPKPERLP